MLIFAERSFARPAQHGSSDRWQYGDDSLQSPLHAPLRSATYPPQARGPSPELSLAQDCAFPPFPPGQSYVVGAGAENRSLKGEMPSSSSSKSGNGQLLQRMNSITPGPFAQRATGTETTSAWPYQRPAAQDNQASTMRSSPERPGAPSARPSTSGLESATRAGPIFSRNGISAAWEPEMPLAPLRNNDMRLPGSVALPNPFTNDTRPKTPQSRAGQGAGHQELSPPRTRREISPHSRKASINRPLDEIGSMSSYKAHHSHARREGPTSPTKVYPRSASANGMHSEQESFDNSTLTSAKYLGSSQSRSASATGHRGDRHQDNAPPLPAAASLIKDAHLNSARSAAANNGYEEQRKFEALHDMKPSWGLDYNESPYHTPTKSVSSTGSSNSDHHTASSRSSPPLSGNLYSFKTQDSDNYHHHPLLDDIHESSASDASFATRRGGRTKSFSRPTYATRDDDQPMPPSLMDLGLSATRYGARRPLMDDRESSRPIPISKNPSSYESNAHVALPPARSYDSALSAPRSRDPDSSRRRLAPGRKGNCRGCGEVIIGKSVSSADGRLTGRYHKQCFVCTTCREPFPTNDFYVIDNSPLCARHYHEQNGTMCLSCDRGIEGQYLETETKQKFHSHCFACRVSFLACGL